MSRWLLVTITIIGYINIFYANKAFVEVKSLYPNAYNWYCDMIQKYPSAKLENVSFCISNNFLASTNTIFWPEEILKTIEALYPINEKTQDMLIFFLKQEYILLHEAGHIINNDIPKRRIAALLTLTTVCGSILYCEAIMLKGNMFLSLKEKKSLIIALTTAIASYPLLFIYIRSQESRADNFANQTATKECLEAGIKWHNEIECYFNNEISSYYLLPKSIQFFINDPEHPTANDRKEAAKKALRDRFQYSEIPITDPFAL